MCYIAGIISNEKSNIEKIYSINEILKHRAKNSFGFYFISNNSEVYEKNIISIDRLNEKIKNSIKNNYKLLNENKIIFTHGLFPLVNYVPQPLKEKGIFIGNLEIYNWKELNKKYSLNAKNDSEVLFKLLEKTNNLEKEIEEILNKLDGVYAFAYLRDNKLYVTRDLVGIKPIFISYNKNKKEFAFASEKKALIKNNFPMTGYLDPKKILIYNITKNEIKTIEKKFFKLNKNNKDTFEIAKEKTKQLLIESILKRVPKNKKIGILFSGGIDSTFIAYVLKIYDIPFTCYTAKLEGGNIKEASDYIFAKEIAKKYKFPLTVAKINVKDLENNIKETINIIEDTDYIKVSVAETLLESLKLAKKDNVEVIFSGLGSEEIFAGYRRHKKAKNINLECLKGLEIINERDLYRDDCLSMSQTIELRLPFLDKKLIEYVLNIDDKFKIDKKTKESKIILREIALDLGIDKKYAYRKKQAAQYGSKFDKGLLRLAKNKNMKKQDYLNSLI